MYYTLHKKSINYKIVNTKLINTPVRNLPVFIILLFNLLTIYKIIQFASNSTNIFKNLKKINSNLVS